MHCHLCPTYSLLRLSQEKAKNEFIVSLHVCESFEDCWNEAVWIMHELPFERHAAPNVVIFCFSLYLPFPLSPLASSLTYCTSYLIWANLLQRCPLCLHLIYYFFCSVLGRHWIAASGRRKGSNCDGAIVERKTSFSLEMPCQDKSSLLWMSCETVKRYALALSSHVSLFLYTESKERKERQTHRDCL